MNLIFDFGWVVFEWDPVALVRQHFPEHAPDEASARHWARDIFHHPDWAAFDQGRYDADEAARRSALRLGWDVPRFIGMARPIGEKLEPIATMHALLDELRQRRDAGEPLRLYYLSNMSIQFARLIERKWDFLQWFDGGIYSGDVGLSKPDPAIYRLLMQRHSLTAKDCCFMDDLSENLEVARSLGWQTIWVQDHASTARDVRQAVERCASV